MKNGNSKFVYMLCAFLVVCCIVMSVGVNVVKADEVDVWITTPSAALSYANTKGFSNITDPEELLYVDILDGNWYYCNFFQANVDDFAIIYTPNLNFSYCHKVDGVWELYSNNSSVKRCGVRCSYNPANGYTSATYSSSAWLNSSFSNATANFRYIIAESWEKGLEELNNGSWGNGIDKHKVNYDPSVEMPLNAFASMDSLDSTTIGAGDVSFSVPIDFLYGFRSQQSEDFNYRIDIQIYEYISPIITHNAVTSIFSPGTKDGTDLSQTYKEEAIQFQYENKSTLFEHNWSVNDFHDYDIDDLNEHFTVPKGGKISGYTITQMDFYARNVTPDYTCSNWVRVSLNCITGKVTYTEVEYDNNRPGSVGNAVSDSNQYPPGYKGNGTISSNIYDNDSWASNINNSIGGSPLDYMNNGFGIIGNNGVLTMLHNFTTFIPEEFWQLAIFFFATMVTFAIAVLAWRAITG